MQDSRLVARIAGQCAQRRTRSLYRHHSGLHYWLHTHGGRLLMVSVVDGNGFEVPAPHLSDAHQWQLERTYMDFQPSEDGMCKIHPNNYDTQDEQVERFHKGVRGVFRFRKMPRMCKFCRQTDLYWHETSRGYRLFSKDGKEHDCPNETELY